MADNTVTVVGNLTRDPELRFTQGGRAVASFGIANNRRYQVNDEWKEEVSFFNVVAWSYLGENAAASLTKGARIVVTGRLTQRNWEDNEGKARSTTEIVADEIGAALRFATVDITRTERSGAGDRPPATAYDDDPRGQAPAMAGAPSGNGDEEPF